MGCVITVPYKKEGYLSMKKIIAQLLILTLVFSSFAVFPAGAAAAEEVGDAVYYNRTYDEEGKDIKDGLMIVAKSNKIELDGDDENKYIKMEMADPVTEDAYIEVSLPQVTRYMVFEVSLSSDKLGVAGNFQFKDAEKKESGLVTIAEDGTVASKATGKSYGKIKRGKWLDLAVALDLEKFTYTAYVDGKAVEKDQKIGGTADTMTMLRLYLSKAGDGASLLVDNFRIYEATEPMDIDGKEIKAPTNTFNPGGTATANPSSGPIPDVEDMTIFDVDDKAAIEARGLVADKKNAYEGKKYAAEWTFSKKEALGFEVPKDMRGYKTISFNVYAPEGTSATLLLRFMSNDAATEGDDYYMVMNVPVNGEGWQTISYPLSKFKANRQPLGWDQITKFEIFTTGWGMTNDPETTIYLDSIELSTVDETEVTPAPPTPTPTPVLDTFKEGVALLVDNSNAYAKETLTKVDVDNAEVAPVIVGDRTLVPVRFISESFDAAVSWDEAAGVVGVESDGKSITLTIGSTDMIVDGQTVVLDVPAETINDRTMIPLRALVEALGKNVFWDERGLILITNPDRTIDASADSKLVNTLLGYLKTGKLVTAYNQVPQLTQAVIDEAVAQKLTFFNLSSNPGWGGTENMGTQALFHLALATYVNPEAKSTSGVYTKDRALEHIRNVISGGKEPMCSNGPYWAHAILPIGIYMCKNTPAIWNELTAEEIEKIDLLMESLAISVNWGYNDENDYSTGLDMKGNFGKTWNPNYRCSFLPGIIMASLYFDGADKVNAMFEGFDYDAYMERLDAAGFTNIKTAWSAAGKELMENGGSCTQVSGASGGSGKGVKLAFKYNGMELSDYVGITENLVKYTYGGVVRNDYGTKGSDAYAYIMNDGSSPYLGQNGMMLEFCSSDANGIRSDANYCYDSMSIMVPYFAALKLTGKWDSDTEQMQAVDSLVEVGTEDLIYKLEMGYQSYSKGEKLEHHEYSLVSKGYRLAKDVWRKVMMFAYEPTTIVENPNATPTPTPRPTPPPAEPQNGVTSAPAGALEPVLNSSVFPAEAYHSLGKAYTGKVTMEFDLTFAPDVDEMFDGVIAYANKDAKELTYQKSNMLIQLTGGTINVYNGTAYQASNFDVAANYKYHIKVTADLDTKKYSVWITPIYPTAGDEVLVAENCDFRGTAEPIEDIGSLILVQQIETGGFWIENHTTNGDLLK